MRRVTRLTNVFSKKLENHATAVALHYMHCNFARIQEILRVTPPMQAGLVDHVWPLENLVMLLDAEEAGPGRMIRIDCGTICHPQQSRAT